MTAEGITQEIAMLVGAIEIEVARAHELPAPTGASTLCCEGMSIGFRGVAEKLEERCLAIDKIAVCLREFQPLPEAVFEALCSCRKRLSICLARLQLLFAQVRFRGDEPHDGMVRDHSPVWGQAIDSVLETATILGERMLAYSSRGEEDAD